MSFNNLTPSSQAIDKSDIVLGIFPINEVLKNIECITHEKYKRYGDYTVNMGNVKYLLFSRKGITCKNCHIIGHHFKLERHTNSNDNLAFFNLYAIEATGEEILLTKDHIIPLTKSGSNKLENLQVLCVNCNRKKKNKIPKEMKKIKNKLKRKK